ncbi:hypothetical protein [Campylobacter devanensis]|uniref:hypothetical protein n=1 Tax=Campylobacter devanensis TaxID=3161138 RepID=UPI000A351EEB|nr:MULTISPECIES: hypothetical protein [unclassified Campylobacter]
MAKFNLLNSIYNTIGDIQATNALGNINAFNQPNFINCDSLRFIATKAFYSKFTAFLQRQDLQMSPTNIKPKSLHFKRPLHHTSPQRALFTQNHR